MFVEETHDNDIVRGWAGKLLEQIQTQTQLDDIMNHYALVRILVMRSYHSLRHDTSIRSIEVFIDRISPALDELVERARDVTRNHR